MRTGIFLCTCDGRIEKGIDVNAAQAELSAQAPDALVTRIAHACRADGLAEIARTITANSLDQVVVAACPERFQGKRLSAACAEAGVAPNRFALVDWREGCANAHRKDRSGATRKAADLVRMGLARAAHRPAGSPSRTPVLPGALVLGGGIAGMTAAKALAARGIPATLVERAAELGGGLRQVPLNSTTETFRATVRDVILSPRVALYLNSRVVGMDGAAGAYHVDIAHPNGSVRLSAGAVIVATGARELADPHLARHDGRRVLTLGEFEPHIPALGDVRSIVYLLCPGSTSGPVAYCPNVCCAAALHQALRVRSAHPDMQVTILFRDLYLQGEDRNEQLVLDARAAGIEFLRYAPTEPPRIDQDEVTLRDVLTGKPRRVAYDRLVLATPLVPQHDAPVLARWLHLPRDTDGFLMEPHDRIRPESQLERGIFLCGAAHRPVDIETAIEQGELAAARAARFLRRREIVHPAASAFVDTALCTGCAQCVETCAFAAISMHPPHGREDGGATNQSVYLDHAHIDPFLCLGCGNCVVACPSRAIDLPNAADAAIVAQIDAALANKGEETRELVFGCAWSGAAAMELAGARRLQYSARVRVIELPCSARLAPMHVLYALLNGADRVLLALCPPDECHYGHGNRFAEMRIDNLRAQLAARGLDPQAVSYLRLTGDDAGAWVRAVAREPA